MNASARRLVTFLICSMVSTVGFCATPDSTDAADLVPVNTQPMLLCPTITINGKVLTLSSQPITLGNPTCVGGQTIPGTVVVFVVFSAFTGGGELKPSCPPDMPYMGGFDEIWVGAIGLGVNFTYTCCQLPQPQMSASIQWTQNNAGACPSLIP